MTMTATVSVSQQSAHVNQHDADKDLYFDWMCAKLLILYTSDFDVNPFEIISDAAQRKSTPINRDDFIKRALGFQRHK